MNSVIHYSQCPACSSSAIHPVLIAKDYTVSGESFSIWQCNDCSLRFTQDVPTADRIGKYYKSEDYISHTNTSKGFINQLYQIVRRRTLRQKRKMVCNVTGKLNGDLLDIGSGTGAFVNELKENGWTVVGLEPDKDARKVAAENNIDLRNVDELFHLTENSFDAITLWHVLEHVHTLQSYLDQCRKLLKENGRIIIAVPNYTSLDAAIYKEYWAAYDVPRHLYHFSPVSMKKLVEKSRMRLIDTKPMLFDSFYVSLLSSKYKNAPTPARAGTDGDHPVGRGRTNWFAAFWNGLRSNLNAVGGAKKSSSIIYIIGK